MNQVIPQPRGIAACRNPTAVSGVDNEWRTRGLQDAFLAFPGKTRGAWKAMPLSSVDTVENNPEPTPADTALAHDEHAHDENSHDHEHSLAGEHSHGPVLNPDCTRELVLDVPAEDVSKSFRRVTREYQKYAKIPGFRPGKVPEAVVRRKFANEIRKEVIDSLLPERFNKAVHDLGVTPVGQPQVTELTVEEGSPLHVKAVFEFIPAFSIEGYQNVTVPKPPVEIIEDEVQQELQHLRESRATMEPVEEDRPVADGDWAQISYTGNIHDEEGAPPLSSEDALVEVGGKDTVEAFTSALRDAKAGQTLEVAATYPAEYPENRLAGKTVDYTIDVKAIKKRNLPELNDEFAKEVGNFENLADLEKRVRENLANRKRRAVESETKDKLFAALIERFPFPVPESLVQEQVDARLDRGLRALAAQGMQPDQMRKLDFGRLRAAQRESAVAEVKTSLLLARIAHEENVTVSDEELDREIHIAALQSREPVDTLKARLTQDGGLARIREQLKREKTAQLLYERLPA
jgi:trigger factor